MKSLERWEVALYAYWTVVLIAWATYAYAPAWDGAHYYDLARNLMDGRGYTTPGGLPDHHRPPLWPFLLFLFDAPGAITVPVQMLLLGGVCYAASYGLWRDPKAALRTALLSMGLPGFTTFARLGYPEPLAAAFYVLLVFFAIKSIRKPALTPWAGVFAGLVYLTKASVGYAVAVGGVAGLLWRFRYHGPRVLLSRHYLGAVAAVGVLAGMWVYRNVRTFGWSGWEMQPYASYAFGQGPLSLHLVAALIMGVVLTLYGVAVLPSLLTGKWGAGERDGLVLSALLPATVIIPLISGFAWVETGGVWSEALRQVWDTSQRYVLPGLPVMALIAGRERLTSLLFFAVCVAFAVAT